MHQAERHEHRGGRASADGSRPDFAVSFLDTDAEANWPIVAATFVPPPKDPKDFDRGATVMKVFDWAYRNGGAVADRLGFVPPPTAARDRVRAAAKRETLVDGDPVYKEPPPWPTLLDCR